MDDLARPDLDLTRPRAGDLPTWVRWLVVTAAVTTVGIALVVPGLFLDAESMHAPAELHMALGALVVVTMIVAAMVRSPMSILARIAVVLPLAHLVMMVAVGIAWVVLGTRLEVAHAYVPLVDALPIGAIVAAVGAAILLSAWVIARRRRREVVQVAVTIALVQLLLLGLWIPIASSTAVNAFGFSENWVTPARVFVGFDRYGAMAAFALVPPLVGAVVYAALATRRARWLVGMRSYLTITLVFVLLVAFSVRSSASATALVLYLNFVPWLLAAAFVAVAMIALLCGTALVSSARRRASIARDRRQFAGIIAGDPKQAIGVLAIRSWLRGPELVVDGFEVETAEGPMPVPPGATLAAPLPLASTGLHVGEGLAVLHAGTAVGLTGFDRPADGSPFRRSLAPTATVGVVVGPEEQRDSGGFAQVALAAWRPAVAYLLIFLAAAMPALGGLMASRW